MIENETRVLILQHPQEKKNPLNSAPVLVQNLTNARLNVGLSWRSLSQAWGQPVEPSHWAVLYVGTNKQAQQKIKEVVFLNRKGIAIDFPGIEGIVLLDGNWKQSKTLWWRNPWLLKLHRIQLSAKTSSLYGNRMREPRPYCRSTLEAAADTFDWLGESSLAADLRVELKKFIAQYDSTRHTQVSPSPSVTL